VFRVFCSLNIYAKFISFNSTISPYEILSKCVTSFIHSFCQINLQIISFAFKKNILAFIRFIFIIMGLSCDFWCRKKKLSSLDIENTKLARVLGIFDITALGIACTIGSGIYVLTGTVINHLAGPAVILSFVIASIATFLSG
jgi:hypothetical protein